MARLGFAAGLVFILSLSRVWAGEVESVDLGGAVRLEVVSIPAGEFSMGSPADEKGRGVDEDAHPVQIAQPFNLGRFPVTHGQFAQFVKETGYKTEAEVGASGGFGFDGSALIQRKDFTWRNPGFPQADNHPVVLVTYADAIAFCKWVSRKTGRSCSLPSEAQWEYACRAGTTTRFYSGDGDEDAGRIAWFKANAGKGTRPVGELAPNAFGLSDMSGNVYQWCETIYAAYVPGGGVQGPMDKPRRVIRGGSWLKDPKHVRSAARARNTPGSRNADNGFRVVLGPPAARATTPPVIAENPNPPEPAPPTQPNPVPAQSKVTPPTPAPQSSGTWFGALVIFVVILLILFLVAWFIYSLLAGSSPSRAPGTATLTKSLKGVQPRVADDGFWFDTTGYNPGDVVTYSYRGPNGMVAREFMVEPSPQGQFIYTGMRPSDIVLGMAIANAAVAAQVPPQPRPVPVAPPPRRDDDDSFRGFPSAY